MEPCTHVRVVLAEARRRGLGFSTAWTMALQSLPRKADDARSWAAILSWAAPAYRAAYEAEHLHSTHPDPAGWDQDPTTDATLLHVNGFDQATMLDDALQAVEVADGVLDAG